MGSIIEWDKEANNSKKSKQDKKRDKKEQNMKKFIKWYKMNRIRMWIYVVNSLMMGVVLEMDEYRVRTMGLVVIVIVVMLVDLKSSLELEK